MQPLWRLSLKARSPALLGGVEQATAGVHSQSSTLPAQDGQAAALLGSSIRGVLRHDFRRFAEARGHPTCTATRDPPPCACTTCQLFGTPGRSGKVAVRTATATGAERSLRTGVAIDRRTRTSDRSRRALRTESRAVADFEVAIDAVVPLPPDEHALLGELLAWEAQVGLRLGRGKSAGAGLFTVEAREAAPGTGGTASVRAPAAGEADRRPYLLDVVAAEPLRLAGVRQRTYYRDSLPVIPSSTLRGAIGWALVRAGRADLADHLFEARPIALAAALPVANGAPARYPSWWLGHARCRGSGRHHVDVALARIAAVTSGGEHATADRCPECREPLKLVQAPTPQTVVLGHTEIDPATQRARHQRLFYEVAVAPGQRFRAEVWARPDQAEAIATLGTVYVGGRRAHGLGRAQVTLAERAGLPPVAERIERTTVALRRLDEHAGPVAVLGVLGAGATPEPQRELLSARGLQVVTAMARTELRGGWDERARGGPVARPLRRLLAGGSWIAVQADGGAVAALEELECDGVEDPQGTDPLRFRVRDDLGGDV